jgi:hypothetical protein
LSAWFRFGGGSLQAAHFGFDASAIDTNPLAATNIAPMLSAMQSASAPSPASLSGSGFASLFASLTAPKTAPADRWNDDLLADDVTTISYEQALRTHARTRRPDPAPAPDPEPDNNIAEPVPPPSLRITEWAPEDQPARTEKRKSSSITLRMSPQECDQLHQRAADASLTVSAYVRSCVFEAEALRAQVKEALVQLKPEPAIDPRLQTTRPSIARSWAARLFPGRLVPGRFFPGLRGAPIPAA